MVLLTSESHWILLISFMTNSLLSSNHFIFLELLLFFFFLSHIEPSCSWFPLVLTCYLCLSSQLNYKTLAVGTMLCIIFVYYKNSIVQGHLAGSVNRAWDSWSPSHEYEPTIGLRDCLKLKKRKKKKIKTQLYAD